MNFDTFSDEAFAAYLAGFTDGEGCIYLPNRVGYGVTRITLANCVRPVLVGIQARLGYGSIKSQRQREHWRERFTFDIYNAADCERFLMLVRPYLHIKAAEADEALRRIVAHHAGRQARQSRNTAIREAILAGERQRTIAVRFGISEQTVSRIKAGHRWLSEHQTRRVRSVS